MTGSPALRVAFGLLVFLGCSGCSSATEAPSGSKDAGAPDQAIVFGSGEDALDEACLGYEMWFCPPMTAVWQREVFYDRCSEDVDCEEFPCTASGKLIIKIGECEEYMECNPLFVEPPHKEECVTEKGFNGEQDVFCEKGFWWYGPCVACGGFEVCNGLDDNCNGGTDEGNWGRCDGPCGDGPQKCIDGELVCQAPKPKEEVCDYKDNDCDDLIDEGQTNACGKCGLVPPDTCNNNDDDCDGLTDEGLVELCTTPCDNGFRICLGGDWGPCSAPQPAPEKCNLVDDDCDGLVDEDLICGCPDNMVGALFTCKSDPLLCGQGWQQCQCMDGTLDTPCADGTGISDCHALCYFVPEDGEECVDEGEPVDEECNKRDDDCDSLTDENLFSGCYSGPSETEGVGSCHGGQQICFDGEWGWENDDEFVPGWCFGEMPPSPQDYCNGSDEDCDGITDDGEEMQPTDVCFVIDWSGSMGQEIDAVMAAMTQFALYYHDEELLQWCLVLGPMGSKNTLWRVIDLSSFLEFQEALADTTSLKLAGGLEPLLDALWLMLGGDVSGKSWIIAGGSDPPMEEFSISWRGGPVKKLIILWTDEVPQSFLNPKLFLSEVTALVSSDPQLSLYVFSGLNTAWKDLATAGGGEWYKLVDNAVEMFLKLMEIFDEVVCE